MKCDSGAKWVWSWDSIPEDILTVILKCVRLADLHALVQCRCRAWISVITKHIREGAALLHAGHLSVRQTDAVMRFLHGQNLFITGIGGGGKSFVVSAILNIARERYGGGNVLVAASTSSAATQLMDGLTNVTTIHSLVGAKGQVSKDGKTKFEMERPKKHRNARVLFLDEVGMVQPELFSEAVRTTSPECQIVATGDLLQLQPVGGGFVFQSPSFRSLRPVELTYNFRAGGLDTKASIWRQINKRIRLGLCTAEDERWIRENSLQEQVDDFALYAKNQPCLNKNRECFERLTTRIENIDAHDVLKTQHWQRITETDPNTGEEKTVLERTYAFVDSMERAQRLVNVSRGHAIANDMRATPLTGSEAANLKPPTEAEVNKVLRLRIGTQVVLTRAIWAYSDDFPRELIAANGEVGEVLDIDAEIGIVRVRFPPHNGDKEHRIVDVHKVSYKKGCLLDESSMIQRIWVRKQVPLDLGYARTAHKAQGASLHRPTHVDAINIFMKDGPSSSMIYLLTSRAKAVDQLHFRKKNGRIFDIDLAKPHEEALEYQNNAVSKYKPLGFTISAIGYDDTDN